MKGQGYERSRIYVSCAVKVDLQKAFDSVDWRFLLIVLQALMFPLGFIQWIKGCLTKSRFSVFVN